MGNDEYRSLNQQNYSKETVSFHAVLNLNSTMRLAYRDLHPLLVRNLYPNIKSDTITILDFGCGVGVSTQIVSQLIHNNTKFQIRITGVDVNEENLTIARQKLPHADFRHIAPNDDLRDLGIFDLIICNFVLVEMPEQDMIKILSTLNSKLSENGILIVTNPSGSTYHLENRWYTINNQFPENVPTRKTDSGKMQFHEDQPIKVQAFVARNSAQSFTFHDYFHSDTAYKRAYVAAGLTLLETHKPKGIPEDNIEWLSEKGTSPYKIHVLK